MIRHLPRTRQLLSDDQGLTTIEYAVLFVILVVAGLALWTKLGASMRKEVAEGTGTFNSALGAAQARGAGISPAFGSSPTLAAHSSNALGAPRPSSVAGSAHPTTAPGAGLASAAQPIASAPNNPSGPSALPQPSAQPTPAPEEQSTLGKVGDALIELGKIGADTTLGAIAGVTPFGGFVPVKPPFGHNQAFGQGMLVGSAAGMIIDAGEAGGDALLTTTGVLVPITAPAAVAIAASATGHMANWEKGTALAMQADEPSNTHSSSSESAPTGENPGSGSGSGTTPKPSSGAEAVAKGAEREQRVATITGGKVSREPIKTQYGSSDLDVVGPKGELIAVGGPAKAGNLSKLGTQLKVLKEAAAVRGVPAQAYFERGTPQSAIDLAIKKLGKENVFIFD